MNAVLSERVLPSSQTVQLVRGDITDEATDAIVNAANARLIHGGGIAAAIVGRGGPAVEQESDAWVRAHGPVLHERPAWTSAGRLACKYVIHAVGPIWGEGNEDQKLSAAAYGALRVADELKLRSVSLPAISTGIFGFPKRRAAGVILEAVGQYFSHASSGLQLVRIVLFDKATIDAFTTAWEGWS